MKRFTAFVERVNPLTNSIAQVFLRLSSSLQYKAGQYLKVITSTGERVPFSIANAPLVKQQLELHIRHTPENTTSMQILSEIQTRGELHIEAPFGECTYLCLKPQRPVIFMARGSGFAPVKAIIEQLLMSGSVLPMHLYWGIRNIGDQYLDALPESWAHHVENFQYTPVLCPENIEVEVPFQWKGRSGDLIEMIAMDHYPDLFRYQILAAGPFQMMLKAREVFVKQGLLKEHMYSDAFTH